MVSSRDWRYILTDPTSADLGHPQFTQRHMPPLSHVNAPHDARRNAPFGDRMNSMLVRFPLDSEAGAVVELLRQHVAETLPHLSFDSAVTHATFRRYLATASPTIFVVEGAARELVGVLVAFIEDYAHSAGFFIGQDTVYVRPDYRESTAAADLLAAFDAWVERLQPTEVLILARNAQASAGASEFTQRGYRSVGPVLHKVPEVRHVR